MCCSCVFISWDLVYNRNRCWRAVQRWEVAQIHCYSMIPSCPEMKGIVCVLFFVILVEIVEYILVRMSKHPDHMYIYIYTREGSMVLTCVES